jgi:hypothetical protein
MENYQNRDRRKGLIRFSKETERAFFFYATIAMLVIYCMCTLFGD